MKPEELNFIGTDPGAVKFGNFMNYYSFHSAKQRMDNLQREMFPKLSLHKTILCLDIGCNTGELTIELHSYMKNIYPNSDIYMLAIDIDPVLIQRAKQNNICQDIVFETANIMDKYGQDLITDFLNKYDKRKFDITFTFSVTMWIHINNGDEGLEIFLKLISNISNTIIIEPQPWQCYRNAQRRVKKSGSCFPLYESLQVRSDVEKVIQNILTSSHHKIVHESESSAWRRKIQCYQLK